MTTPDPLDVTPEDDALAHLPVSQAKAPRKTAATKAVKAPIEQDVETLKNEVKSLAVMLNGLKNEPGESVHPSRLNNVLARLETLERREHAATGVDTSVVDALRESLSQQVAAVAKDVVKLDDDQSSLVRTIADVVTGATPIAGLTSRLDRLESVTSTVVNTGHPGNVHHKVLALMDEVMFIGKDRSASGGGVNFKFRGIEDAQNAVGAAMRKVRILLRPEVVSWDYGQEQVTSWDQRNDREKTVTWSTSRLTMRYVFVSPDDGSEFVIEMVGEGKDNSDKSASKAASMACKYALFQALMIPFEQVDESDAQNDAIAEGGRRTREDSYQREMREGRAAERAPKPEPTQAERAAAAVRYVREATGQPADVALPAITKAKAKVEAQGLGDVLIDDVPVSMHVNTALQMVNAAIQQAAAAKQSAQGMTRAEQQAGEGQRAAVAMDPDMEADLESGTAPLDVSTTAAEKEYQRALESLRGENGDLTDEEVTQAEGIVTAYERGRSW